MKNKQLIFQEEGNPDWLNEQQFAEIFNQYWKKLLSYCIRYTNDKELSLEIVQQIFCSLWERRSNLAIQVNIGHYLFRAAKLQIASHYRTQRIRAEHDEKRQHGFDESDNSTEEEIYFKELYSFVQHKVEALPSRCQEVYTMSRNKGMTIPQIAQLLALSEKTVEAHLTKALRTLREKVRFFITSK